MSARRFKRYPAYKDSGVEWLGEIPAGWEVAPVYARYEVALGKMLDAKRVTGQCSGPYLRNVDVQWDRVNTEGLPEMDFAPWERDRYSVRPGDLLVCEGGEVDRTAIWRGEIGECFYQKALHRVRPRAEPDAVASPEALPRLGWFNFVYLHVGAPERTLEFYEAGVQTDYSVSISNALLWHPYYASLRKTERYEDFMRKRGVVEYWRNRGWPELCRPLDADDFTCN